MQRIDSDCLSLVNSRWRCGNDGVNRMGRLDRDHKVDTTNLESSVACPAEKDGCHDMSYVRTFMSGLDATHNRKISCQSLDHIFLDTNKQ